MTGGKLGAVLVRTGRRLRRWEWVVLDVSKPAPDAFYSYPVERGVTVTKRGARAAAHRAIARRKVHA